MKKFIAELIGTCVLVTFGCGTAMITGCEHWGGYLLTALAFGLVIVGMAYCVGNISGCHINPAVSLAVFMNKGMSAKSKTRQADSVQTDSQVLTETLSQDLS